jgi:hypothetical protein
LAFVLKVVALYFTSIVSPADFRDVAVVTLPPGGMAMTREQHEVARLDLSEKSDHLFCDIFGLFLVPIVVDQRITQLFVALPFVFRCSPSNANAILADCLACYIVPTGH